MKQENMARCGFIGTVKAAQAFQKVAKPGRRKGTIYTQAARPPRTRIHDKGHFWRPLEILRIKYVACTNLADFGNASSLNLENPAVSTIGNGFNRNSLAILYIRI